MKLLKVLEYDLRLELRTIGCSNHVTYSTARKCLPIAAEANHH
jgi:hypothetical protein